MKGQRGTDVVKLKTKLRKQPNYSTQQPCNPISADLWALVHKTTAGIGFSIDVWCR